MTATRVWACIFVLSPTLLGPCRLTSTGDLVHSRPDGLPSFLQAQVIAEWECCVRKPFPDGDGESARNIQLYAALARALKQNSCVVQTGLHEVADPQHIGVKVHRYSLRQYVTPT